MRVTVARSDRYIKKYIRHMEEHRLYSVFGSAFYHMIKGSNSWKTDAIALAKEDGVYIGVAVLTTPDTRMCGCNVGCYVKWQFRRQGIGSKLVNKLIDKEKY